MGEGPNSPVTLASARHCSSVSPVALAPGARQGPGHALHEDVAGPRAPTTLAWVPCGLRTWKLGGGSGPAPGMGERDKSCLHPMGRTLRTGAHSPE